MISVGYVSAQKTSSVFITGEAIYVDKEGNRVGPKDPNKLTKLYGKNARIPLDVAERLGLLEKAAVVEGLQDNVSSSSPITLNPGADDSLKTSETLNSEQEEKKEEKKEEVKPDPETKMITPENKMLTGDNK